MVKHLTKHGNSLALVIDRGVLDILDISAETPPFRNHGWETPHCLADSRFKETETLPCRA